MNKIRNGQNNATWILANVRNKSFIAKANRVINKGASTYCGGSISTIAHYEKMTKELQRLLTAWEVVEKTKKLKTKAWVNNNTRKNGKGNIYGLSRLSNKAFGSTHL
ncbi:hypothetical protein CR513_44256, partial [Mucuna pruriens]